MALRMWWGRLRSQPDVFTGELGRWKGLRYIETSGSPD